MISLALDASGRVSGVCLVKDGQILGEMDLQIGLTHSETLLPLCISLLEHCKVSLEEVDQIFLCKGPGSFTGLRIGAATGKGLALAGNIPLYGISTLEMLQENLSFLPNPIHVLLDARRGQVYTASYRLGQCISPERAVSIEELLAFAKEQEGQQIFLGDGIFPYRKQIEESLGKDLCLFPNPQNALQRAASLALLGEKKKAEGLEAGFHLEYLRRTIRFTNKVGRVEWNLSKNQVSCLERAITTHCLQSRRRNVFSVHGSTGCGRDLGDGSSTFWQYGLFPAGFSSCRGGKIR